MPDFETLPLGTQEELVKLREMACWLVGLAGSADPVVSHRAQDLKNWYEAHQERYS